MSASLAFRAISAAYVAFEAYKSGILLLSLVVSYGCSSWVLGLDGLQLLYTSQPAQIAVALLGLALFPSARARLSLGQSSSTGCSSCPTGQQDTANSCSRNDAVVGANTPSANSSTNELCSSSSQTFRLARPPFVADLSYGVSSTYSCSSTRSISSKARRRRLPRVSIELTPLPRLSLEFQHRARSCSSSRSSLDSCSFFSPGSADYSGSGSPWHPSMSRIRSGHDLQALGDEAVGDVQQLLTAAPWTAEVSLQDASITGEATESLGHGVVADGVEQVGQVISETHLLQVGAMLGEASSRAALVAREAGGPVGHPMSFYGSADTDEFLGPWDLLVSESNPNVLYWAWRRPLRKGLYMYMTRSVFLDASPAELRAFMNDDAYRVVWDNSMTILRAMAAASLNEAASGNGSSSNNKNASVEAMAAAIAARMSGSGFEGLSPATSLSPFALAAASDMTGSDAGSNRSSEGGNVLPHESAIMQALVQFPKPMASRSYIYARRVWDRPSDGGCYCLSKSCTFDKPLPLPCRAVAVEDYVAGCVIRAPAPQLLPPGTSAPAAEVLMVYYEDSHVRPGLANLGIKKGLWPLVQKTEKALRVYQAGAAANLHLQTPQPKADAACSLQSSNSTPSSGLSRAASLTRQGSLSCYGVGGCASAPCSPEKTRVEELCTGGSCETAAAAAAGDVPMPSAVQPSGCSGNGASACHPVPAVDQQEADSTKAATISSSSSSKAGSGGWEWWHTIASTVGGAIKGSGQLIAAASVALWRSHTRLALMVPTLEWRLLHWFLHRLADPTKLLLGASSIFGASSSGGGSKLQCVSSHPIGDSLHPGLLQRYKSSNSGPTLLRVSSHPIAVEDLMAAAEPELGQADDVASAWSSSSSRGHNRAPATRGQHCGSSKFSSCCCCAAAATIDEVCTNSTGVFERQQLLRDCDAGALPCADHRATCVETASVVSSHSLRSVHSTCCLAAHQVACCCSHAPRSRFGTAAGAGDDSWSRASSLNGACSGSCCASCNAEAVASAAACLGCSASCCGSCCSASRSRCSSRNCSSMGGSSSRVSGGGRRQRKVIVRLMQAASMRLAHKLLSALENSSRN